MLSNNIQTSKGPWQVLIRLQDCINSPNNAAFGFIYIPTCATGDIKMKGCVKGLEAEDTAYQAATLEFGTSRKCRVVSDTLRDRSAHCSLHINHAIL